MRTWTKLIATLALVIAAAPAIAQAPRPAELWRSARAGDTGGQILSRFEEAVRNPAPETLASRARCNVHIPHLLLGSQFYQICFFLRDDHLTQVTLRLRSGAQGPALRRQFDAAIADLRRAHGPEARREDLSQGDWFNIAVYWDSPGRRIAAVLIGRETLNINYQATNPDGSLL